MAKTSTKRVFFLLAAVVLVVVCDTLVIGVNGQEGRGGEVFPPQDEGGGWPGSRGRQGGDWPGSHGRQGEGDQGGRGGQLFPPDEEKERGRGGQGGWGGWGGGGSEFPPGPGSGGRRGWTESRRYILSDMKRVVATDAGGMRVVKGVGGRFTESPMHIGFITMEPNSMFIPQYLDSSLILFVELGEARIGSIYKDKFVEKDLKSGDLYRIQAGSAFYLVNTAQGQRLHIITSIDTAESTDWHSFESFAIGGGSNPASVLAGFDINTLATAMNVSYDVVDELLSSRKEGAIVYLNPDAESRDQPSMWKRFLEQGTNDRKAQMKRIANVQLQKTDNKEEKVAWWLRKILVSLLGKNEDNADKSLDSYNIYDRKADFRNDYGWSVQVDGDDYEPLKLSDFGVYLVNLTAGSMMAPHINPTATEYGVVLSGIGNIQVVFPNGTLAMDAEVKQGDVFWIPRYFPFCQVASRSDPFVFFGFSTSARNNRPQFLAGQGSLLQAMMSPELAAAFGLSEERMAEIVNAQTQTTILPAASASPGGGGGEIPEGQGEGDPAQGKSEGSDQPQGKDKSGDKPKGEAALLIEKMGSNLRTKKSSFGYNMAMGMD